MRKKQLSIYLFIILLGGMFWSRALLSITISVWAIISFIDIYQTNKSFFKSRVFKWSLLPLFFWLLGSWQEPMGKLNYDYLLTLSAYPATIFIVQANAKECVIQQWIKIWLAATMVGLAYPLYWYFGHFTEVHQAYGSGQSLPTFMDTDHVRFSIFLCASFLLVLSSSIFKPLQKLLIAGILFVAILFLAVRTGWVLATCILILFTLLSIFLNNQANKKLLLSTTGILFLIVLLAYAFSQPYNRKWPIVFGNGNSINPDSLIPIFLMEPEETSTTPHGQVSKTIAF